MLDFLQNDFLNLLGYPPVVPFICFLAGFLTALSPCVYPIIPLTLASIGMQESKTSLKGFYRALIYVSGMILFYVFFGFLSAYFGFILGSFFQHPVFLLGIALFLALFALSMWDVFSFSLPLPLLRLASGVHSQSAVGLFFMGALSGLLAAPCTGPVAGFILTLISQKAHLGLGVFWMFCFAMGLGFPFLLLGTFTGLLKYLPKTGPWMLHLKRMLGLLMLLTSVYYASLLWPKPKHTHGFMKLDVYTNNPVSKLNDLLNQAKSQNKPVFMDFYADWCVACRQLEQMIQNSPLIQKALSDWVSIQIDLTTSNKQLDAIQKLYNVVGLPVLLFFDLNGKIQTQKTQYGFIREDKLLELLKE